MIEVQKATDEQLASLKDEKQMLYDHAFRVGEVYDKTVFALGGVGIAFLATYVKDFFIQNLWINLLICLSFVALVLAMLLVALNQFIAQAAIFNRIKKVEESIQTETLCEDEFPTKKRNEIISNSNSWSMCLILLGITFFALANIFIIFTKPISVPDKLSKIQSEMRLPQENPDVKTGPIPTPNNPRPSTPQPTSQPPVKK